MSKVNALRVQITAKAQEVRKLLDDNQGAAWNTECQAKYDSLMASIDADKAEVDRDLKLLEKFGVDEMNAGLIEAADRLVKQGKSPIAAIHAKWLRGGDAAISAAEWQAVRATMSTTTPSEGGYTVATEVAQTVADALKNYGGVREVATVINTEMGNPMSFPTSNGTSEIGEQVAENAAASDEGISFGAVAVDTYKFSSKVVTVPIELLQDSAVDLETFINTRLVSRIGRITNTKFTTGSGSATPRGVVTAATAGKVGITGQTTSIIFDDLVDLEHSVDVAYRKLGRCAFMMNDLSFRNIKKMKDSSGRPIFMPGDAGLGGSVPDTILGYPVVINNDIAVMAANAKSVLFGDFSFYIVRDALQMQMLRFTDSAYAKNGQVGFLIFARSGGNYTDVGGGLKYYQNSAT